jgi:ribosome maturation factor RimP
MNTPDIHALTDLLRPALNQSGVELLEVQWKGGGRGSILRLIVDRPGGVDLDDCENASLTASAILDAYDPIGVRYSLEVSSPGAERPLRTPEEWRIAVGRRVNVHFRDGDAEQVVEGRLLAVGNGSVEVEARRGARKPQLITVATAAIVAARIVVDI